MPRYKKIKTHWGLAVLIILHGVGLAGMLWYDQTFFAQLTPLVLLISAILIFAHQKGQFKGLLSFFVIAFLIGFGVEWLGTSSGVPFGEYHYGENMAPLLKGVPLIIGVNWFLLAVGAAYWSQAVFPRLWPRIIATAVLMTIFDVIMEPVAIALDFWTWQKLNPPVQNYLAWFGVSVILAMLGRNILFHNPNQLGGYYFIVVTVFFAILNITL